MLVLKEAELWRLVFDIKSLSVLNEKMIDSNKIELKKKQIVEYHMLNKKIVEKIDKMCTNHVQMMFFSIKTDWTTYELWVHLKKRYSSKRWSSKWVTYNKLETLTYELSIADLKSKTLNILAELKSQNLTIEQIVILKVLNVLKSSFFIYLIVLMKSTRKENKFSNMTDLFQNLIDEENRQKADTTVNLTRQKEAGNESNERIKRMNKMKKMN